MAVLQNRALIVLGMHRSGTSAVTGALRLLGADVGSNLMEAKPDNETGFFEHSEIVTIHNELLAHFRTTWREIFFRPDDWLAQPEVKQFQDKLAAILLRDFAGRSLWAIKDPRLSRLLPAWEPVLADLQCGLTYLYVVRHPLEVAHSLMDRDGLTREKALQLWLDYNLTAERDSRQRPRAFVFYNDFLRDWRAALAPLGQLLEGGWPRPIEEAAPEIDRFVNPGQRHQRSEEKPGGVSAWIWEAYQALAFAKTDEPRMRRELDSLGAQWRAGTSLFAEDLDVALWRKRVSDLKEKLENKKADLATRTKKLADAREKIEQMESSLAWKLGKPLRHIKL
jgi:hypothetical protein